MTLTTRPEAPRKLSERLCSLSLSHRLGISEAELSANLEIETGVFGLRYIRIDERGCSRHEARRVFRFREVEVEIRCRYEISHGEQDPSFRALNRRLPI